MLQQSDCYGVGAQAQVRLKFVILSEEGPLRAARDHRESFRAPQCSEQPSARCKASIVLNAIRTRPAKMVVRSNTLAFVGRLLFVALFVSSAVQKLQSFDAKTGGPIMKAMQVPTLPDMNMILAGNDTRRSPKLMSTAQNGPFSEQAGALYWHRFVLG